MRGRTSPVSLIGKKRTGREERGGTGREKRSEARCEEERDMKRRISLLIAALLFLMPAVPALAQEQTEAEAAALAALRQKWSDSLTGGHYDRSDPDIQTKVDAAASSAAGYASAMEKNIGAGTQRLWPELTLEYTSSGEGLHNSVERLRTMALAYSYQTSALYQNQSLKADILRALQFLNDRVYHDRVNYVQKGELNWYYWEIGVPKNLVDILALMYDEMDAGLRGSLVSAVRHFTAGDPGKGGFGRGTSTGANLTWKCMIYAVGGAAGGGGDMVRLVADRIHPVFDYADLEGLADGFYTDGSYIQHSNLAYTGGYGVSTIADSMGLVRLLDGTPFALDSSYKEILLDWSIQAFLPVLYNGNLMDMVRGREITRYNARDKVKAAGLLGTLFQIAELAEGGDRETLLGAIKRNVTAGGDRRRSFLSALPIAEVGPAKAMLADSAVRPSEDREYAKIFGGMDRAVYRGADFAFGISMYSKRISAYEAITDDNPQGWYTGFGMTYLYNGNLDHYSNSYWPTADPAAHAGTTVSDVRRPDGFKGGGWCSTQSWAGGAVLDGKYAAAGMMLEDFKNQQDEQTMAAKKSWFMFGGKIVALGTGITSPHSGRRIKTTVDNRILSGSPAVVMDGEPAGLSGEDKAVRRYIHVSDGAAQTGYYVPAGGAVTARLNTRSGSWKALSNKPYNPDTRYTNTFYTITADHGTAPVSGGYAYIVMPGASAEDMEAYSQNETIQIMENSGFASGVSCAELGLQAVNFWRKYPHKTGDISASGPASVIVCETGGRLVVAAADPTQEGEFLEVTVDRSAGELLAKDARVTVLETAPRLRLLIDTAGARGASAEAAFQLAGV